MENSSTPTTNPISQSVYPTNMIKPLSGWATLIAVLTVIGGAFASLTIIGAIIGIPQIIAGVKLLKAVDVSKGITGSDSKTTEVFDNINSYFKINGIIFIVSVAFSILIGILFIALGVGAIMQNLGNFPI